MGKIKVESLLKNNTTNEIVNIVCYGIKNGNKIIYNDNNIKVIIKYNDNLLEITRESIEYTIYLKLEENKTTDSIYYINNLGNLNILTKTKILSIKNGEIKVIYEIINTDDSNIQFELLLKYEVI